MSNLNTRQKKFVDNILKGMNQKKAYIQAGYNASGNAAEAAASRLLNTVKVQEELEKKRRERTLAAKSQLAKLLPGALQTHNIIQKIDDLNELSKEERQNLKLKLDSAKDILDRCLPKSPDTEVNIAQKFDNRTVEVNEMVDKMRKKLREIEE